MGRLSTLVFVSIIAVAGSIGIAPPADAVPSCVSAGEVTALESAGCNLGSLNFADFAMSPVGLAAKIYLGAFSAVVANNVNLSFQVAHDPSPATLADIVFTYTVKTLSGLPELGGVDLFNAGSNVTIKETICATKFVGGVCPSGALANYVVAGGKSGQATFSPLLSAIYINKDIQFQTDGFISEFMNSHDEPPGSAPEPATLMLLGGSLVAAGFATRRRVARKLPGASGDSRELSASR
jgi:PEP-CTERM motif-containing protein